MFAKIFQQIFDSSIAENYEVRHVFEDMLKLADREGAVDMTMEAIARRTNVPLDKIKAGIEELCRPDPQSRTREHEGRRLLPISSDRSWGWVIVNYKKYREIQDEDARRAAFRDAKRRQRHKASRKGAPSAGEQQHEALVNSGATEEELSRHVDSFTAKPSDDYHSHGIIAT